MGDELTVERARSFEQGATAYERFRPEFPEAMFDDVVRLAGDRLQDRVLEVGAGTGRATLPLARRGARIHVVEPSADMLRVLAERLQTEGLADLVTTQQATFEDVDASDGTYGVMVAAQSFHWADAATRWERLASVLGSDGLGFLCWNGWHVDPDRHNTNEIQAIYAEHGAGLTSDVDDHRSGPGWAELEVEAKPWMEIVEPKTYEWDWSMPTDDYFALLTTTSQYAIAPSEDRARLFDALRPVLGETVSLSGRTLLLAVRPVGHGPRLVS
ncbi:class I SAM-dependent methyltransferase [Luteipulveratus mongoliensis]|uniref:Methyltransferase domain-containing protein n=1 Tax=Luteipulveratus mongoliensis TaxID=571913 RepID=A0A0K1JFF1_9MICO|nr:class I SAM-dependent methyltransferase [Luteipulveratus mongoliensis]AKU15431.1 hypothetical protein VV02_05405 [Luteipulveratus mongoliensis]